MISAVTIFIVLTLALDKGQGSGPSEEVLLIVSGNDKPGSQVMDFYWPDKNICEDLPTHPLNVIDTQGGVLNSTTPVICGGLSDDRLSYMLLVTLLVTRHPWQNLMCSGK